MNLNYVFEDEKGNVGQQIQVGQGETRTITCFWFLPNGIPYSPASIVAMVLKIFAGLGNSPVQKSILSSTITLISGNGGYIGFQFTITPTDSNLLPVSSTINMSASMTDSGGVISEQDFPSALNVTTDLVP